MIDSFMQNHQSALDNQREDDAIQDLQDAGIYPDPGNEEISVDDDDSVSYTHLTLPTNREV